MKDSKKFIFYYLLPFIIFLIALTNFTFYLYFVFKKPCSNLGYTLCAAVGEDFFALYQAAYNFFNNNFIYGPLAKKNLITPYFVIYKYFPIAPLIVGTPFLFYSNPVDSYNFYLVILVICHLVGAYLIHYLSKLNKLSKIKEAIILFIWFSYFPLLSDWRMGQFNYLSGFFFFLFIFYLFKEKIFLSGISWLYSLAVKPVTILLAPLFFKKEKKVLFLFIIFFIIFTGIYLLYHFNYYPQAFKVFFDLLLLRENRSGWQIHYIDNFSFYTFLGELFYDKKPHLWFFLKLFISGSVLVLYLYFTIWYLRTKQNKKDSLKNELEISTDVYLDVIYSLYSLATLIIYHKEVWESWLTLWLFIIVILLILCRNKKEIFLILVCASLLGSPSLFKYYSEYKTSFWRLLLISEKAIPQMILYLFLLFKIRHLLKEESSKDLLVSR